MTLIAVCHCVQCGECGGSGCVWVSFSGEYLGARRCSDFDDLETCDECNGSGLEFLCDECAEAYYGDF